MELRNRWNLTLEEARRRDAWYRYWAYQQRWDVRLSYFLQRNAVWIEVVFVLLVIAFFVVVEALMPSD